MKISIVIPCFNRENLIGHALESVLNQTYQNWECIVIDDYSTDNTKGIVDKYAENDFRIKYFLNSRKKGAQGSRNTGILISQGEWISFLDSDDTLTNNSIEVRVNYLLKLGNISAVGLIYGDMVGHVFRNIQGNAYPWVLKNMALCPFSVMMVNKSLVFKDYLLDEIFPAWQDDDLVFEISLNYEIYHCDKVVATFAPNERTDSITKNRSNLLVGLEMMIKKRKINLIKDGGRLRFFIWNLRLLTFKLEQIKTRELHDSNWLKMKLISILIFLLKLFWQKRFDVKYA